MTSIPVLRSVSVVAAVVVVGMALGAARPCGQAAIPLERAGEYFAEAKRVCEADGGRLWGVSLCGPIMFVDPASRTFVASEPDREGMATKSGGVFTGVLPPDQSIANTAFTWAGVMWTQIIWPPPEDPADRRTLMAHELFHRVQIGLGFRSGHPENQHLDTVEGRYLLQLEWRALAVALRASDAPARRQAIDDALAFRQARRRLFATASAEEKDLELFEGLAEYTGVVLADPDQAGRVRLALRDIERQTGVPTFIRSFPYAAGPAYGLLLDAAGRDWKLRARAGADLGELLATSEALTPPADTAGRLAAGAARYDGRTLHAAEQARWDRKQARLADYRRRLIDGPILRLALVHMKIQFDPRTLEPLGDAGVVYPTLRVTDDWGVLTVTGGALLAPDWRSVAVPAPKEGAVEGDGWTLQLNPGWKIAPGAKPGSYAVAR